MVTVQYRRWCPPKSPLRIEFPPGLLHDVRLEGAPPGRALPLRWIPRFNRVVNQSSGLLFGVRHEDEVRVLAARADSSVANGDGLALVGIFVCRARGEVFLTDDDLDSFEKHQGVLALVVAGGQAGFFVREPDGSVQAIRSHEEFRVDDVASRPASGGAAAAVELPAPPPRGWRRHIWRRLAACAGLLTVPAGALAYWQPLLPRLPIALALREEAGQLVIGWNASAIAPGSRLEIREGSERNILLLPADTSGATYGLRGGDVEVRLTTDTRLGGARWEAARFANRTPREAPAVTALRGGIDARMRQAQELRRSLAEGHARTEELAAKIEELTARPER